MPGRPLRPFGAGRTHPGRASRRQERRQARETGGRRQPASGSLPGRGGDVLEAGRFLGELKFTAAGSYRLTLAELRKIEREAAAAGRWPYHAVEFRRGAQVRGELWVTIPWRVARDLLRLGPGTGGG